MSVITSEGDDYYGTKGKGSCGECSKTLHRYPFLEWGKIRLCAECCRKIKRGFTADMIQLAAIEELHDIGYREYTLVRKQHKDG